MGHRTDRTDQSNEAPALVPMSPMGPMVGSANGDGEQPAWEAPRTYARPLGMGDAASQHKCDHCQQYGGTIEVALTRGLGSTGMHGRLERGLRRSRQRTTFFGRSKSCVHWDHAKLRAELPVAMVLQLIAAATAEPIIVSQVSFAGAS